MTHTPEAILADLRTLGVLPAHCRVCAPLPGGTGGGAFGVGSGGPPEFVLKLGDPGSTAAEARFLQTYGDLPLLPRLRHADPGRGHLVYAYIPGATRREAGLKASALLTLAGGLVGRYLPAKAGEAWGWLEAPSPAWPDFLAAAAADARSVIGGRLSAADHAFAQALAGSRRRQPAGGGCLIHGDCGFHNFVFDAGRLRGVIDPLAAVGPPIFDLIYAFCSTPADLEPGALEAAARLLPSWDPPTPGALWEEALVGLYCRLATCLRHHPDDLAAYLSAWPRWRALAEGAWAR